MGTNTRVNKFTTLTLGVVGILILAACQPAAAGQTVPTESAYALVATATPAAAMNDAVTVVDQSVDGGKVTIAEVDSSAAGWLVIHADNNGSPGTVLGYTAVKTGVNKDVVVTLDDSEATPVLYAMLHLDAGQAGVYEFPGTDAPVMVDGAMVSPTFNVTGGSARSSSSSSDDDLYSDDYGKASGGTPSVPVTGDGEEIKTASSAELGTFLVDEDGMTLYLFTKDSPGVTTCFDACLQAWPPLLTNGEPRADDGVTASKLGTITRDDGSIQVTYNGLPLYYYITDVKPGDTTGQGVGGVWFVVEP